MRAPPMDDLDEAGARERALVMPDEEAPRPVPRDQPYLDMRRWANAGWPGREDGVVVGVGVSMVGAAEYTV